MSRPDDRPARAFTVLVSVAALGLSAGALVRSAVLVPSAEGAAVDGASAGHPDRLPPGSEAAAERAAAATTTPAVAGSGDGSAPVRADSTNLVEGSAAPALPEGSADPLANLLPGSDPLDGSSSATSTELSSPLWAPIRRGTARGGCLVTANRTVMATSVVRREPAGTTGPFTASGEPLFLYLDAANTTGVDQRVTVRWHQRQSDLVILDALTVNPIARFRTWADRPLPLEQLGPWVVQVVDAAGCLVSEVEFDLTAPGWDP